mmetsp:Transcript_20613/g.44778  ORF Transcript_20613/g.44778 Transcript_20613/m.44778 type:complete len:375 (+) Transcript_20613:164-1288(+)
MMWAFRNKKIVRSFSRGTLFSTKSSAAGKKRTRSSSLATLLFLGTTIGGSSFHFSRDVQHDHHSNGNNYLMATSSTSNNNYSEVSTSAHHKPPTATRSYTTKADEYFQQWHKIPLPFIMHDNLERLLLEDKQSTILDSGNNSKNNDKILVIGDVHGCLEELKSLVQNATNDYNDGIQFAAIVLVGDLCNKGPSSAEVIAHVRNQPRWFTVRGNHDDRALSAALGDEECCSKRKYQWVNNLSDDDVTWLSNLPYTITIPKTMLNGTNNNANQDVIIVHAGLDSTIDLESQETTTMITVRNLIVNGMSKAWAKIWQGPELIIFGHDAKRGLQREEYAIGLDSGCVYGKKLTGIILPERQFVSVDALREHCTIKKTA